jgi:hypothetical protein
MITSLSSKAGAGGSRVRLATGRVGLKAGQLGSCGVVVETGELVVNDAGCAILDLDPFFGMLLLQILV